jgi:DNA-directed RNA polymerase subunit RPC12/RpoP
MESNMDSYSSVSYRTHACPACGAELILKNRFSKTVVCSYCQSLVLLNQNSLQDTGKIARLSPDMSVLQIGCRGIINNIAFEIIGRLKMTWENGFWNEWYVIEETGSQAWIAEAMGFYSYIYEQDMPSDLIQIHTKRNLNKMSVGEKLEINNNSYSLLDIKEYVLTGIEGEVPFNIEMDQQGKTLDFKTQSNDCMYVELTNSVTDKNSQGKEQKNIRFFLGKHMTLESLHIANLREFDDWTS